MRITADTSILVRALSGDDVQQGEAALALLDAGGDVADGAIAYEGRWLGASLSSPTLESLHIVRRVTPSQKAI